jgi:hypothetical protein
MKTLFQISITRGSSPERTDFPPLLVRRAIDEDLGAGAAGAGLAHLPEVVLRVAVVDVVVGQAGNFFPDAGGVHVTLDADRRITLVHGYVQARRVDAPDLREQLPRPRDRVALEVVTERPVAEHLEERVVPARATDIVKIVVLAASADALLRVGGTGVAAFLQPQEDRFELVHPRVREEQRRVVLRDDRRARHERVAVLLNEEVDELLADLG